MCSCVGVCVSAQQDGISSRVYLASFVSVLISYNSIRYKKNNAFYSLLYIFLVGGNWVSSFSFVSLTIGFRVRRWGCSRSITGIWGYSQSSKEEKPIPCNRWGTLEKTENGVWGKRGGHATLTHVKFVACFDYGIFFSRGVILSLGG